MKNYYHSELCCGKNQEETYKRWNIWEKNGEGVAIKGIDKSNIMRVWKLLIRLTGDSANKTKKKSAADKRNT